MEQVNKESGKPYSVSASMGGCVEKVEEGLQVSNLLNMADVEMYKYKIQCKKQRI